MKTTLSALGKILGVDEIILYPSTESNREVAINKTKDFSWIVMTKVDEKLDLEAPIWVVILDPESEQYPGSYDLAAVITNKAPKEGRTVKLK